MLFTNGTGIMYLKMKKYINSYIKSFFLITAFLIVHSNGYSQNKKQEFSISLGGPFSFLNSSGLTVSGNGVNAGLRYSYYLNEGLSVGIGVEYQTYNSDSKLSSVSGQYSAKDDENEPFQFRYKVSNLREEQNLSYINIPVNIQFETPGTSSLYLAAGAKIGFATNGAYKTSMSNLTTSGYYPQYNLELFGPAFAGFVDTDNVSSNKQDLDADVSYSATFETGLKQQIGKRNSLYLGVYFDYGLNNIFDHKGDKNLVQYSPEQPVILRYNSVFDSGFTNKVNLVSYGLKLRIAMR